MRDENFADGDEHHDGNNVDFAPLSGSKRLQQCLLKARERGFALGLVVSREVRLSSLTWRTSLRKDYNFCCVKMLVSARNKTRQWSIRARLHALEKAIDDLEKHVSAMTTLAQIAPNEDFRPYQVAILSTECGRLLNGIEHADRLTMQISHAVAQRSIERTNKLNGLEYAVFLSYLRLKLFLDLEEHPTFESAVEWCRQYPSQPQAIKYSVALPPPALAQSA